MEDIWQQFHRLPKAIRDAVASPKALATLDRLEQEHPDLDLAGLIMRAMVKEFPVSELPNKIQAEYQTDAATAKNITDELTDTVFSEAREYLGLAAPTATPAPVAVKLAPVQIQPPVTPAVPVPPVVTPPTPLPTTPLSLPVTPEEPPDNIVQVEPPSLGSISPTPPKPVPVNIAPPAPVATAPTAQPSVMPQPPRPVLSPEPSTPTGPIAPTQAYSEEDAKEIEQQANRLKNITATAAVPDFDEMAKQVMEKNHLGFADELMSKRANAIFKARLKDIRNSEDTVMMMTRPPKLGGLGLDQDLAQAVVKSLESAAVTFKDRGMVQPPTPREIPMPPRVPTIAPVKPAPMPPIRRTLPPNNLPVGEPDPVSTVTEAPRPAPLFKRPADIPPPPPIAAPVAAPKPTPTPIAPRPKVVDRRTISDVVAPQKTFGPAEEMRSLTLTEFRRLGQGALDSTKRLWEKLLHWQRESFTIWLDAVSGWRQSEVYQLYLAMGRDSLEKGLPISEIVALRAKAGQSYLSEHEFTAIADFNRQLQL